MLIKEQLSASDKMSPYPFKRLPFMAVTRQGTSVPVPPGTSLPDLLQLFYGEIPIDTFKLRLGFVTRDNKVKKYNPGAEDPFIFHSDGSKQEFFTQSLALRAILMRFWKAMNLPTKKDEKRFLETINTEPLIQAGISKNEDALKTLERHYDDIVFTTSNLDIANKFCLVRSVTPGWWAHSYSGKPDPPFQYFEKSIKAHMAAITKNIGRPNFKSRYSSYVSKNGDPLETNPGYWNYNASGTKDKLPAGKIELVTALAGIGTQGYNWPAVVEFVKKVTPDGPLKQHPFAVALLRRSQAGYKDDTHCFEVSNGGMFSLYDVRGMNTTRIAFIFPYILNLMLTPMQLRLKTARALLPGCYHDGPTKIARANGYYAAMNKQGKKVYMAEADFANYDRFLWIGVMNYMIAACYPDLKKREYYTAMFKHTHSRMPLLYPNYDLENTSSVHAITPTSLGLLSGAKPTGEVGTFYNSIVTSAGLLNKGLISEGELHSYLEQHFYDDKPGSSFEHNLYQSDDNLIQAHSMHDLLLRMDAFKDAVTVAGLKSSVELGDRFLMRHCSNNADLPVPSRVYQNTLSGEDSVRDPIKFAVGFAMRSDGMMGLKSIDPFGSGKIHTVTAFSVVYSIAVIKRLLHFFTTASIPVKACKDLAELLISAGEASLAKAGLGYDEQDLKQYIGVKVKGASEYLEPVTKIRQHVVRVLAQEEMNKREAAMFNANEKTMLTDLRLNSNVPSEAYLMDQLIKLDPSYAGAFAEMAEKEHKFFQYAMKEMNLTQELEF